MNEVQVSTWTDIKTLFLISSKIAKLKYPINQNLKHHESQIQNYRPR